jgi:hypothetical protein
MGSSGGQTPVTQQTTQTKDPWGVAQPFLTQAMQQAQNLYVNGVGYQPYTGQTQAPLDPNLTSSLNSIAGIANSQLGGTAGVNAARNMGTGLINSYGLSPEMQNLYNEASTQDNPFLQGAINQQVGRANAAASGMGRYGSGAHDAAIAQAISPIMAQDYARRQQQRQDILTGGLTRQGQWAQNMPALDVAQYAPAQMLGNVGQFYQDRAQQELANQIKQYNAQQAYPWEQLARYNAILGQAGGLGGSQVTVSPGATQPSTTQRLFGGALAGAGLGASIGGLPGAGIGAVGGGLLGLL